jgi:hypothetical protein
MSVDDALLAPLIEPALRGDAHEILGFPPRTDLRAGLASPPEWTSGSYERLIALYVAADHGDAEAVSGVIYDFAEHTYFGHDDDGYALAALNADLCALYAAHPALRDDARAHHYLEAALSGPDPQGVREDLEPIVTSPSLRERLQRVRLDDAP